MKNLLAVIYILSIFLIVSNINAAPVIDNHLGIPKDDGVVIIMGSDFGSNDLNYEWLGGASGHIENALDGAEFSRTPDYGEDWLHTPDNNPSSYHIRYDAGEVYSGNRSIEFDKSWNTNNQYQGIQWDSGATITYLYVSQMTHINLNGNDRGQWKRWRFHYGNLQVMDSWLPQVKAFTYWNMTGDNFAIRPDSPQSENQVSLNYGPREDEWVREELFMSPSSASNTNDGTFQAIYHRPGTSIQTGVDLSNQYYYGSSAERLRYYVMQTYIGNWDFSSGDNPSGPWPIVHYDDIYISDTQARVEIGNNAVWGSVTHREIQPPSAWTATSITIKLNQATFADDAEVWLYVIDADGNVSNGYPITLGKNTNILPAVFLLLDN